MKTCMSSCQVEHGQRRLGSRRKWKGAYQCHEAAVDGHVPQAAARLTPRHGDVHEVVLGDPVADGERGDTEQRDERSDGRIHERDDDEQERVGVVDGKVEERRLGRVADLARTPAPHACAEPGQEERDDLSEVETGRGAAKGEDRKPICRGEGGEAGGQQRGKCGDEHGLTNSCSAEHTCSATCEERSKGNRRSSTSTRDPGSRRRPARLRHGSTVRTVARAIRGSDRNALIWTTTPSSVKMMNCVMNRNAE